MPDAKNPQKRAIKDCGEYYCVVRDSSGSVSWHGPFRTHERAEQEFAVLSYDLSDIGLEKPDIVAWRIVRKGQGKTTPWQLL